MAKETRHGKIPQGWTKQGLQVPKHVADEFKHHAEHFGGGGVKFLGTVALDLINQMPDECRERLASIAYKTTWPDPLKHDPKAVWRELVRVIADLLKEAEQTEQGRKLFWDALRQSSDLMTEMAKAEEEERRRMSQIDLIHLISDERSKGEVDEPDPTD
jgi:hypothetical protein